jgi:hypothetical protein
LPTVHYFANAVSLFRKILLTLSITMLLLGIGAGGLWFKFRDNVTPDIRQHAVKVWHGQADLLNNRTRGELIRYALRRFEGHPNLETLVRPALLWVQRFYERPVPDGPLPTLGKGQQTATLPPQNYDLGGQPIETQLGATTPALVSTAPIVVVSVAGLLDATRHAKAGQIIEIAPGNYQLHQRIDTDAAGTQFQPITLRAAQPGQVTLNFNTEVAFRVSQPYWVFENMHIRGVCKEDRYCEHAFHIFGAAESTVVRNNLIEDFNADIKINGADNTWPDDGLVQYNTLINTRRRETANPVTLIDLVGANHWRVSDNIISNFVKGDGNLVAYGVFMKGASRDGRIERNLIICTPNNISQPGVRVGISFGGGTTGLSFCRDKRCEVEHKSGLAANNIVAHCNDFGVDVNDSTGIVIAYNTLINTAGIDVRGKESSARIYGNMFEGVARQRDGASMTMEANEKTELSDYFESPDSLNFVWRKQPERILSLSFVSQDFYGQKRQVGTSPGALDNLSDIQ